MKKYYSSDLQVLCKKGNNEVIIWMQGIDITELLIMLTI
jgi:hypothetical protein